MAVPIFSPPQLSKRWQQYLARARQYRSAAIELADYVANDSNWPRWFLNGHAIELTIKAYIVFKEDGGALRPLGKLPHNHDLTAQYEWAVQYGLPLNSLTASEIAKISDFHWDPCARYPDQKAAPPSLSSDDL